MILEEDNIDSQISVFDFFFFSTDIDSTLAGTQVGWELQCPS